MAKDDITSKELKELGLDGDNDKELAARRPKKLPVSAVGGAEGFRNVRTWVDSRVLPILAWGGLIGLSVVGANTVLSNLSMTVRITGSIFVVAFLAFKLP